MKNSIHSTATNHVAQYQSQSQTYQQTTNSSHQTHHRMGSGNDFREQKPQQSGGPIPPQRKNHAAPSTVISIYFHFSFNFKHINGPSSFSFQAFP